MSGKAKFVKVNAAQERATAAKYAIQAVPTLFIFKGGEVAESLIGFQSEDEIRKRVTAIASDS
jgi:thioredoxin 1